MKPLLNIPNLLIVITVIFTIIGQIVPLINILNFEFSFVFSIILFIAFGILTIYFLRKFKTFGMLPAIIRIKYKIYLTLLLIPIIISIISNLFFQLCPFGDGIIYYLVIVLPASYFGLVTGAFSFWANNKYSYLIFIMIFVLFSFVPIIEFYIYPQVYFFNIIVGFIPGTIYDEEILLSGKLILYRIIHLVLFSILLFSITKVGTIFEKNRRLLKLSTFLGAVLFFLLKPYLGFAITKYDLYNNLKMSALSTIYEIRYTDNITYENAQFIGLEHFYYMYEIERKTKLSTPKNLITYIFKDANQKGTLFGSKAANVAKPWMNQIFLDYNSLENTLEHELIHIYASEIGSTIFKIAGGFNMAMLEGYAMAIEENYSGYDIHYMASLAKASGYNFNISKLFKKFNFFRQNSTLSYISAGSFIKFLIEKYGIEKVNIAYNDLDFEKHFGKKLENLEEDYNQYLKSLNYSINKHSANLFFGRNPITKKVCPRSVANELNFAWKLFNEQNYYSSMIHFNLIFQYSNSYTALLGLIYSNNKLGFYSKSLELLKTKISEYENSSFYYSSLLNYGDQLALNNKFDKADSVYQLLYIYEPTLRYKNIAEIRVNLIKINQLSEYLKGSDFDKYVILKSLNGEKLLDSSIPILIELSERLKENNDNLKSFLLNLSIKDLSSNTLFEISKYLMNNNFYNESLKFAELSLKKCTQNFTKHVLESHLRKVTWFCNVSN